MVLGLGGDLGDLAIARHVVEELRVEGPAAQAGAGELVAEGRVGVRVRVEEVRRDRGGCFLALAAGLEDRDVVGPGEVFFGGRVRGRCEVR